MKENVFVIMGIDCQIPRIKIVVSELRRIYRNDVDIAISNYGVLWSLKPENMHWENESKKITFGSKLSLLAKDLGIEYYQPPENTFSFFKDESPKCVPNNELLSIIHVSLHFYNENYENVFILQNDIRFIRGNIIDRYKKYMTDKWAFIAPILGQPESGNIDYHAIANVGSEIAGHRHRWGIYLLIFNKLFVNELYERFKDEETMYFQYFKRYSAFGDLALFDIAKNKDFGYRGVATPQVCIGHGSPHNYNLGFGGY